MPQAVFQTRSHSRSRKTVQVSAWVKPAVKAELQRIASQDRLSLSQTCATLLEEAIRQKLHIQHAVLLQPIIEQAIRKQQAVLATKLTWLLVRIAYDAGQTRTLAANILDKLPGVNQADLAKILDGSSTVAKRNIIKRTPQITTLIEEVEKWMQEDEKTHG